MLKKKAGLAASPATQMEPSAYSTSYPLSDWKTACPTTTTIADPRLFSPFFVLANKSAVSKRC